MPNTPAADPSAAAIQIAIAAWKQSVAQFDKSLAALSDDALQHEIAPGRNRVYYLLGHLTAVHDRMLPLLGLGERQHTDLDDAFIAQPDRAATGSTPPAAELRRAWTEVNGRLAAGFDALQPAEWFERHNNISPEDFAKEPLRNRLSVLLSRTSHLAMHDGQVRLAVPRP
jgi:hypothetical protein